LAAFVLLSVIAPVEAGETFQVDLETVLKLAGARNLTIEETRLQVQKAQAEQSKANEWWLLSVQTGFSTHYLNGAAMNADGRIFTGVDRNNLWSGLGLRAEIDFNQGVFGALAARQRTEAASHFSLAEKNQVLLGAVQAYFDLKTEQLKTTFLHALADQADTLARQLALQAGAGLRYQSEVLLAESNTGHLKIAWLQAKANWQQKSALLANLLNLDADITLVNADDALVPLAWTASAGIEGYAGRPEFKGLNAELEALETSRKTANEGLLLPKLSVGVQNGVFGAYDGPTRNTSEVNAALLWTIPLGRFTYQGDLKQWDSQISLVRNKLAQFKNRYREETASAEAKLTAACEQMSVGKKALQQSAEALNQAIEREKLGTVKPFEVFQSQQFYLQAQVDYLEAVAGFNKARFAFRVAQGEILVEE
ncbi:MAG: TolC family protein, partial [Methylococcaceae bacterium]|nr:TolC family protein [Methylococcaceae bacterium]